MGKTFKKASFDANYIGSKEVNLLDKGYTEAFFKKHTPTAVIHAASRVGGILKNSKSMYEFYHDNMVINTNVIDCCVKQNIPLIFLSSTCVYPKSANQYPMTEDMLHDGLPEETNLGYAFSKRAADIQLWSAEKQYGYNTYAILYMSNLYGKHDHYFSSSSHFVASFISKLITSKEESIELFGTGTPMRQFTYADDVVNVVKYFLDNRVYGRFNVSNPENLSIKQMCDIIMDKFGSHKKLSFNGTLDGVFRKDVSIDKLMNLNSNFKFTRFEDGIEKLAKENICSGV